MNMFWNVPKMAMFWDVRLRQVLGNQRHAVIGHQRQSKMTMLWDVP